jgi:hypothetical protein
MRTVETAVLGVLVKPMRVRPLTAGHMAWLARPDRE